VAGVVDLSLPDYATLVARAGMNPDAEAARVASAAPADVRGAGTAFGRAGGELDSAFTASMGAQGSIGAAFTNGGAPVLDRGTHVANLPPGFGDAGTRLAGTSGRLTAVAEDLAATMRETSTAVTGLHGELQQTRSAWAARVAAAGTVPDGSGNGLIPQEAIPGLLAERDRIATGMASRVGAVGREVLGRIGTYETVINDAVRLLADHGFVPPAEQDAGPPPAPVVEYGGGADPSGYGAPLMAGYAADPVNTALGNLVEIETDCRSAACSPG
jgi:Hydrolase N-terminal helical domain